MQPFSTLDQIKTILIETFPQCAPLLKIGGAPNHLTVGKMPKLQCKNLILELEQNWRPLVFTVKELAILWSSTIWNTPFAYFFSRAEDNLFHIHSTVPFDQHKQVSPSYILPPTKAHDESLPSRT